MSLCMYVEYTDLYCNDFFACTDFLRMLTHLFIRIDVLCILDLWLKPCPYVCTSIPRLLISIPHDFYACIEFPRMWNSTIFLLVLNSYVRRSNIFSN
jgi:hypothetical protein